MGSYRIINIILAGVLGLIFLYSGFFVATDYALGCYYKSEFGINCVSCGFSRDFANFTHLNFNDSLNQYSLGLFSFFIFQLLLRFIFIFWKRENEKFVFKVDLSLTILLLLLFVGPYFLAWFNFYLELITYSRWFMLPKEYKRWFYVLINIIKYFF